LIVKSGIFALIYWQSGIFDRIFGVKFSVFKTAHQMTIGEKKEGKKQ
jgi:hypothetical protein